jgi:hypothetical protein
MTPINYFTSSLQEILDFMPTGATHKGRDYFLSIHKDAGGYSVQYSCREEAMRVDADGVHYVKTYYLFDTFRTGHTLKDALTSMLTLLHTYREQVLFIPRIHSYNHE